MKTVIVTGGAGFIGSCLVRQLLADGETRVVNLDKLTYAGNLDSLAAVTDDPNHIFVQGDIGDRRLVVKLLHEHRPMAVVNLAAESHVDRSIDGPDQFLQTNVVGTFELLTATREYWESLPESDRPQFRFLHVSTDEVYGSLGESGAFSETTAYAPNSPYSASKAASDHFVRSFGHTFGLPVLTTNCSNNYGPCQFPEKLIPLMILNALEGKSLPVYGDGLNVRDWLFVEDHCHAIRVVLERGKIGEVYNIGGDAERTNLQIVQKICEIVDEMRPDLPHRPCSSLISFVTDRPGHDRRYAIDASKIRTELSWQPRVSFEQGMEETVRWYLEHEHWVNRVTSGKYRRERLGLSALASSSGTPLEVRQFPAFRDGEIADIEFRQMQKFSDQRGWLSEVFREDEVDSEFHPVMAYVSETLPGVVRGPHEHADQADYFAFLGPGDFKVFLWDARSNSPTYGNRLSYVAGESNPRTVIVPRGIVHAYKNISEHAGWVFNLPNRLYGGHGKSQPVDEIRHEDRDDSPFGLF